MMVENAKVYTSSSCQAVSIGRFVCFSSHSAEIIPNLLQSGLPYLGDSLPGKAMPEHKAAFLPTGIAPLYSSGGFPQLSASPNLDHGDGEGDTNSMEDDYDDEDPIDDDDRESSDDGELDDEGDLTGEVESSGTDEDEDLEEEDDEEFIEEEGPDEEADLDLEEDESEDDADDDELDDEDDDFDWEDDEYDDGDS
jgi:hypothetical protein